MAGRPRRVDLWVAAAILVLLLAAAAAGVGSSAAAGHAGGLKLKRIGGFDQPVYVAQPPGRGKLLFVVEQPGTIRVLRGGRELKQPFLNLRSQVMYGGEQGLLSVAFDPRYAKNRRLFVYYVDDGGDIRVDSLRTKPRDPTRADPRSRHKLIGIPHPVNENHNGGQLQFGPDGFLYLGTGDGGAAGDPHENAQNPDQLLGKLLRIEPNRKHGYSSPPSNPYASGPGRDEIYSIGLRNPYRFSFDRATKDLWIGDVGQDKWEEIDHESLAGARAANFGWDLFEGTHPFEGSGDPPPDYQPPVFEYSSSGAGCAVTGGYVSRDPSVPKLRGRYLYADFCGGSIRSLDAANPGSSDAPTGLHVDSPSSFGEENRGSIYVTSLDGPVYRIDQR
jgi:glucose/arabinose dehydrogenase